MATTIAALSTPASDATHRNLIEEIVAAVNDHAAEIDDIEVGNPVDGAITTAKLDDEAVTADKLAADAVTEDKILDAAVTEDKIADLAVVAGKLAAALAALIPGTPTLTADAAGASPQNVSIQLKDAAGENVAAKTAARVWLSDTAAAAPTATAPDTSTTITTGAIIATITAGKVFEVISDANGVINVRLTHAGADTAWFVNVAIGGIVASAEVTVDNP